MALLAVVPHEFSTKIQQVVISKLMNSISASPTILSTIYPRYFATHCTATESWDKDKESF
jgi:hypothetical protein